jgi:hypothetical protein
VGEWIEIELVEEPGRQRRIALEPAQPKSPPRPPRLDGRGRRAVAIGAGVVVVAGIGWAVSRSDGDVSTGPPATTLDESAGSSPSPDPNAVGTTATDSPSTTRPRRPTTTTGPPLVIRGLGGPLLPTPSGLELVGLTSEGDLVDIEFDIGQMTTTDLPRSSSVGAPATILVSGQWTYVERWDSSLAFLVTRGQPADEGVPAGELFGQPSFRGPDPDTFWVMRIDQSGGIGGLYLVGPDGEPLGRSIDLRGWWPIQSDLAGGVVVQAGGGAYVVSESGARRVADGEIAGVGLNHFLVRACDEALACGLFVIDRQSGERRQVPEILVDGLAQYYVRNGTESASVAPDGTAAILFGLDGGGSGAALVATDTGQYRELTALDDGTFSVAWSDDSRYVAYTENRTLKVYDRQTDGTIEFGDVVPDIVSFASRP